MIFLKLHKSDLICILLKLETCLGNDWDPTIYLYGVWQTEKRLRLSTAYGTQITGCKHRGHVIFHIFRTSCLKTYGTRVATYCWGHWDWWSLVSGRHDFMLATFECLSCHHLQKQGAHEFVARRSWPATPTGISTVIDVSTFDRWFRRKHHSPPAALQSFLRELADESHDYGGKVKLVYDLLFSIEKSFLYLFLCIWLILPSIESVRIGAPRHGTNHSCRCSIISMFDNTKVHRFIFLYSLCREILWSTPSDQPTLSVGDVNKRSVKYMVFNTQLGVLPAHQIHTQFVLTATSSSTPMTISTILKPNQNRSSRSCLEMIWTSQHACRWLILPWDVTRVRAR